MFLLSLVGIVTVANIEIFCFIDYIFTGFKFKQSFDDFFNKFKIEV